MNQAIIYIILAILVLTSCKGEMVSAVITDATADQLPDATLVLLAGDTMTPEGISKKKTPQTDLLATSFEGKYSWMSDYNIKNALAGQIPVPLNYRRLAVQKGSFAEWLRYLPMQEKTAPVLLYDQTIKPNQEGAYRVVDIDIGIRDLQQCADAVMRLKAEYHYSREEYNAIHFNYTSGHTIRYSDWVTGKRPRVKGNKVYFSEAQQRADYSYPQFKKYMQSIYLYAGTASLEKELKPKPLKEMMIGDVFIKGGFPGHAVIVVDMAEDIETGEKIFLIAQSYMPAQSIHVLKNFNNPALSPWYSTHQIKEQLITPEWTFSINSLRAF